MKKTIFKAALLTMTALIICLSLASCGGKKLSGTYTMEALGTGTELVFSGSKVTMRYKLLGAYGDPVEAKYKIKDDKITFTFEDEDKEKDGAKDYDGTFDFSENKDTGSITIGKFGKFTKK